MLSQTSRQEILRRMNLKVGYTINEENLSPSTRQAITNLATVQRHLSVITEILRGEQSRVDRNLILKLSSRIRKDAERDVHLEEISKLQLEIDNKITEVSSRVSEEQRAWQSGLPPPEPKVGTELVELKCPTCSAPLPMPTGRYLQCQYCSSTVSIQNVGPQIRSMIQGI